MDSTYSPAVHWMPNHKPSSISSPTRTQYKLLRCQHTIKVIWNIRAFSFLLPLKSVFSIWCFTSYIRSTLWYANLFECCQIELLLSCNWRTLLQGQTVINGMELQAVGTCRAEVTWFRDTFWFDSFNITLFALRWMGGNEKLSSMGYDIKNSLKRRWSGLEVIYRRLANHATG